VTLLSSNALISVPASVMVPAAAISANFTATAANSSGTSGITATYNGSALSIGLTVNPAPTSTATSIWSSSVIPAVPWYGEPTPTTLGLKFRSDVAGTITGIRFYKGAGNNGTHIGLLYSSTGTLLGQATFSGETESGWQQVSLPTAVPITANTTYLAAFFTNSGFAYSANYFTSSGVDNAPLHALRSGADSLNGVFAFGSSPVFPTTSYGDVNYWVDVVFTSGSAPSSIAMPNLVGLTQSGATAAIIDAGLVVGTVTTASSNTVPAGIVISAVRVGSAVNLVVSSGAGQITVPNVVGLTQAAATTAITGAGLVVGTITTSPSNTVSAGSVISENPIAGTQVSAGSPVSVVVSTGAGTTSTSIWNNSATPDIPWFNYPSPMTLGLKFRSDVAGTITGIRFYKADGNSGSHIGLLYSSTGTLLGRATFIETTPGWQQVSFSTGIPIAADTTYVAAYFTTSGFPYTPNYFTLRGVDNAPLHALRSGVDGSNGVYALGGEPVFPTESIADGNSWVDVVFAAGSTTASR
jgi:hypothetical protein